MFTLFKKQQQEWEIDDNVMLKFPKNCLCRSRSTQYISFRPKGENIVYIVKVGAIPIVRTYFLENDQYCTICGDYLLKCSVSRDSMQVISLQDGWDESV